MDGADDERVIKITKEICNVLFNRVVKPDLESASLCGTITTDDLVDRYSQFVDHACIFESVKSRVDVWKNSESDKTMLADSSALCFILERHKRIPSVKKIEATLGEDRSAVYKTVLEDFESIPAFWAKMNIDENEEDEDGSNGATLSGRWKTKSLEIVYSLIVDVIRPFYGSGRLQEEYVSWRKKTYGVVNKCPNAVSKREFWRKTGMWVISKSDEEKWLLYGSENNNIRRIGTKKIKNGVAAVNNGGQSAGHGEQSAGRDRQPADRDGQFVDHGSQSAVNDGQPADIVSQINTLHTTSTVHSVTNARIAGK